MVQDSTSGRSIEDDDRRDEIMSYYDRIARKWHEVTGYRGGAFKRHVLNEFLLGQVQGVSGQCILELGAGNGYFMPMLLERYSGQEPERIVISDISSKLLAIAQRKFRIGSAEYRKIDVRQDFPFDSGSFDLILATMMFNEVSDSALKKALIECHRVLSNKGILLVTVIHPMFVDSLRKRGQIKPDRYGLFTMPGADQLRLPVFQRAEETYDEKLRVAGFVFQSHDLRPTQEVMKSKPGLKQAGNIPLALVYRCAIRP